MLLKIFGILSKIYLKFTDYIFGNERFWPLIFGFTIIPAIIQLVMFPFCPESPKFTLINRGNGKQAEHDLKKLRQSEVMRFIDSIKYGIRFPPF